MSDRNLRILVVDDTALYRKVIADLLADAPGVDVVGVAANGRIALQKCELLRPDLLTLDLEMPEVDGLETLRRLREAKSTVGAIMLSAFTTEGADATMAALRLGAFDFVVKPSGRNPAESAAALRSGLLPKIRAYASNGLAGVKHRSLAEATRQAAAAQTPSPPLPASGAIRPPAGKPEIVAIGISTGGPQALAVMLPSLPADLPVPVLVVQHMPPLFTHSLAAGLNDRCGLAVGEAVDQEDVRPGRVLIAPGGKQMKVERSGGETRVRITNDPPENSCRPSADYLFRSIAHAYGPAALGVVMTGMGNDGTMGSRLLKRQGATILTQDEATCTVYGMPKAVADEGLSDVVAPLDRIGAEIARLVRRSSVLCR